jgi:prepilin-type N-terminal cleavage/methylation domain-containing protein/prepilin-type processing-associated H-X9-DG protein
MNKRRGFTLIELLVVIAVIALLMGILMPVLARAKEQAKQQLCATRIRQHLLALNMYADDNNTKLPLPDTAGSWLQDVAVNTVHFMLRTGMKREIFYCPSNANHQKHNDYFWMFDNQTWDGKRFRDESGFVVSGYCYILQLDPSAPASGYPRGAITRYAKDGMQKVWLETTMEKYPAMREVVVDSIMGVTANANTRWGYNFAEVAGGIYAQHEVYDRTNHLKGEIYPLGGNIGFLDGHTEWRKFDPEMNTSSTNPKAVPRFTYGPAFFW